MSFRTPRMFKGVQSPTVGYNEAPPPRIYVPSPTFAKFHEDDSFVRAVMGPVGTGKSVGCTMEILRRSIAQPAFNNKRSTKWAVIRQSYRKLRSTTIETFRAWLGDYGHFLWGSPITFTTDVVLPDQTQLDMQVLFFPLSTQQDMENLRSLELTGAWINEAAELDTNVTGLLRSRLSRYPSKADGGFGWSGLIMDYNPPDTDHWLYELFEVARPEGHKLFKIPPALIKIPLGNDEYGYKANPEAENVANQAKGFDYWLDLVPGLGDKDINTNLLGEYGPSIIGKPVYPRYRDSVHNTNEDMMPSRLSPVMVGLDFGLNPAAVFTQLSAKGTVEVYEELTAFDTFFDDFLEEMLVPTILRNYSRHEVKLFGDPSGASFNTVSNITVFHSLRRAGLDAKPARTNSIPARLEAVNRLLNRVNGLVINGKKCPYLRKGFLGSYAFPKRDRSSQYAAKPDKKSKVSHVHDALQYVALEYSGVTGILTRPERRLGHWENDLDWDNLPDFGDQSVPRKPFLWA